MQMKKSAHILFLYNARNTLIIHIHLVKYQYFEGLNWDENLKQLFMFFCLKKTKNFACCQQVFSLFIFYNNIKKYEKERKVVT